MHELLLLATVPATQHDQLLKILAGIAGMPPSHVVERHVIFKPKRSPGSREAPVGASQVVQNPQMQALQGQTKGELFHLQLIGDISDAVPHAEDEAVREKTTKGGAQPLQPGESRVNDESNGEDASSTWSLCFHDVPEVGGRRPATSRMISTIDILDGDARRFMDALGYTYTSDYALEGDRVIHHNVILLLHRLFHTSRPEQAPLESSAQAPTQQGPRTPMDGLSDVASWRPLDPSGAYILQASVRVQDGGKPESMTLAVNELLAIKETLKGLVELEPGDRLAMDTRVK